MVEVDVEEIVVEILDMNVLVALVGDVLEVVLVVGVLFVVDVADVIDGAEGVLVVLVLKLVEDAMKIHLPGMFTFDFDATTVISLVNESGYE